MAQDNIIDTIPQTRDNAILLLAAAEEMGLDPSVVATTSDGTFSVPQAVADKAGVGKDKPKRAAAKKATAKKTAAPAADDQKTE